MTESSFSIYPQVPATEEGPLVHLHVFRQCTTQSTHIYQTLF